MRCRTSRRMAALESPGCSLATSSHIVLQLEDRCRCTSAKMLRRIVRTFWQILYQSTIPIKPEPLRDLCRKMGFRIQRHFAVSCRVPEGLEAHLGTPSVALLDCDVPSRGLVFVVLGAVEVVVSFSSKFPALARIAGDKEEHSEYQM